MIRSTHTDTDTHMDMDAYIGYDNFQNIKNTDTVRIRQKIFVYISFICYIYEEFNIYIQSKLMEM